MKGDRFDPKGLIREAYNIDGIGEPECRSIFLDWALSLSEVDAAEAIPALLDRHGLPGHPMTAVLQEGRADAAAPRRRGGWRSRPRPGGAD